MRFRHVKFGAAIAPTVVVASAVGTIVVPASAQTVSEAQRTTITVTGSNLPRPEVEGSLPVQVITREEIERANLQTATELIGTISANMSYGGFHEAQQLAASQDARIGPAGTLRHRP